MMRNLNLVIDIKIVNASNITIIIIIIIIGLYR
jgi:hypothetical protein